MKDSTLHLRNILVISITMIIWILAIHALDFVAYEYYASASNHPFASPMRVVLLGTGLAHALLALYLTIIGLIITVGMLLILMRSSYTEQYVRFIQFVGRIWPFRGVAKFIEELAS